MASNFDNLSEEHKSLQTQLKQEKEKENHKCNKCENNSENLPNLKKHRSDHMATSPQVFKCDQCIKDFNDEWKMKAHKKKHKRFQCEQCEKNFEYLYI